MAKSPLFLLVGDPFLCEEKRKEILTTLEKEFSSSLPLTLRRVGEVPVETILSEARTLPFLATAQAFCLRDVDQFTKSDITLWNEYFKSPQDRTFFLFEAKSLERGHPFLEWAGRANQLYPLEPQTERLVHRFIQEKLKQAGKKITSEALELLEARIGESFLFLDSVLEKLILSTVGKPQIDPSDIEAFDERLDELEGDDLLQALSERNVAGALGALHDLLDLNFRDFPSVVGLIHWQLRRYWEAKKWMTEGMSEREVSFKLKLSPARAPYFLKQLRRYSLAELERILEGLFDLDWQLKSGRADGRYEIESWLVKTIG